jgi:hypothetical protein
MAQATMAIYGLTAALSFIGRRSISQRYRKSSWCGLGSGRRLTGSLWKVGIATLLRWKRRVAPVPITPSSTIANMANRSSRVISARKAGSVPVNADVAGMDSRPMQNRRPLGYPSECCRGIAQTLPIPADAGVSGGVICDATTGRFSHSGEEAARQAGVREVSGTAQHRWRS